MILPDGVLQLYPGGDGDGVNISYNNSSNNNEGNVSMDRILSVSSERVLRAIVKALKSSVVWERVVIVKNSGNYSRNIGLSSIKLCSRACMRACVRACVCAYVCM